MHNGAWTGPQWYLYIHPNFKKCVNESSKYYIWFRSRLVLVSSIRFFYNFCKKTGGLFLNKQTNIIVYTWPTFRRSFCIIWRTWSLVIQILVQTGYLLTVIKRLLYVIYNIALEFPSRYYAFVWGNQQIFCTI